MSARTGSAQPMGAGRQSAGRRRRPRFSGAVRSEVLRFARSPLAVAHAACALAAGAACGAYFAFAPWDAALGADAYVQFLGALMPLAAGVSAGLSADEERRAGRLFNLVGMVSRWRCGFAKLAVLWAAGALVLAAALFLAAGIMAAAGRASVPPAAWAWALAGLAAGSLPLYALALWLALRFGRNASIAVGAAGALLAFFSVGGLAHGLATGQLTAALFSGPLAANPFAWAARLGSLFVERFIAAASQPLMAGAVDASLASAGTAVAVTSAAGLAAFCAWFDRFEERGRDE